MREENLKQAKQSLVADIDWCRTLLQHRYGLKMKLDLNSLPFLEYEELDIIHTEMTHLLYSIGKISANAGVWAEDGLFVRYRK